MATVLDVASWFLSQESFSHKKLQKLCYYAKAWSLALLNDELFPEQFEAWVHGPVSPTLYQKYKDYGWMDIPREDTRSQIFSKDQQDLLSAVWDTYGKLDGNQLEQLTHQEDPWIRARDGIFDYVPSNNDISSESMKEFYKKMYTENQND